MNLDSMTCARCDEVGTLLVVVNDDVMGLYCDADGEVVIRELQIAGPQGKVELIRDFYRSVNLGDGNVEA